MPAAKKTTRKKTTKDTQKLLTVEEARQRLSRALNMKASDIAIASRQINVEDDIFTKDIVAKTQILNPPYDPFKLTVIAESNSILPQCIEAMVRNTDGFGYELQYKGEMGKENDPTALAEKEELEGFLNQVNEHQSFMSVRKQVREDVEKFGFGFMEAVRDSEDSLSLIYYVDARYMRLQALQKDPIEIEVNLIRGGKEIPVNISKRFRRFVMYSSSIPNKIKYFKEYGDPRVMDAITGKYEGDKGFKLTEEATEILHIKIGNDTYGIPRWSGIMSTVLGSTSADYVNYDLFENQVVPPLAIMVSGGKLTAESVDDIAKVLVKKRGVKNFNKVLILEAQSEGNIDEKDRTKIELKELSQARKEDSMFNEYLKLADIRVRSAFRLPPLYVGRSETYSKSTADSSKMIGEEQVFVPERAEFDEYVNLTIMVSLGAKNWKFKSKSPRLISGEDIIEAVDAFSKMGAVTINDTIKIANNVLGRDIQEYEQAWAKYPIPIVLDLAKQGALDGVDELINITSLTARALESPGNEEEKNEQKAAIVVAMKSLRKALIQHRA